MPHAMVHYKQDVSLSIVETVVSTLRSRACEPDLIHAESLEVYAHQLGQFDCQDSSIMVRLYADPHSHFCSHYRVRDVLNELRIMLRLATSSKLIDVVLVAVMVTSCERSLAR